MPRQRDAARTGGSLPVASVPGAPEPGAPDVASFRPAGPLPMTREEMTSLGWEAIDVLLVTGDAYVDHPSFGAALLGRWLSAHGFRVGIAAQPAWEQGAPVHAQGAGVKAQGIAAMGRPRLFAGVTAGAIDSMLAHYTAFRKKRHDDAYTPGGLAGARPNRASIVYTGLVRRCFPGLPVVLGGIEASLRRASHYDFWTDSLRRSLLLDSKADLLVYGMGELALLAIARNAAALADTGGSGGESAGHDGGRGGGLTREALVKACRNVPGLAWAASVPQALAWLEEHSAPGEILRLPSHEAILEDRFSLMRATLDLEGQVHRQGPYAVQESGGRAVVITPPAPALGTEEMDRLYGLPYTRLPHPSYKEAVPAWEMIRTSITTHRGCGGGCSFCSLALHQGRRIASRSRGSVLAEAGRIAAGPVKAGSGGAAPPRWAGSISDMGGPSANMWRAACAIPQGSLCRRASCMHPEPCPFFTVDQAEGVRLLRDVAALPGVRHVRVASGVRFDLALRDPEALYAYTAEFTGGQLKVAPEHSEDAVLRLMRKPPLRVFERFLEEFHRLSRRAHKEQYTVPYLMSAFPGCTEAHMRSLSGWLRAKRWSPRQVQCFIPTPGTVATAMFYAEAAPDGSPLYVAKTDRDRLRQHHLLFDTAQEARPGGKEHGAGPVRSATGRRNRHKGEPGMETAGVAGRAHKSTDRPGKPAKQPDRVAGRVPGRRSVKRGNPRRPGDGTRD